MNTDPGASVGLGLIEVVIMRDVRKQGAGDDPAAEPNILLSGRLDCSCHC